MYSDGCDGCLPRFAGGVGTGVIEATKDANKLAIGVDTVTRHILLEAILASILSALTLLSLRFPRRS